MGIDYTTYVGPYITYSVPKKQKKDTYYGCLTKNCKEYKNEEGPSTFCSNCGSRIEEINHMIEVDNFDMWEDFLEPFKESLRDGGGYVENIFMPNTQTPRQSSFDNTDSGCYEVDKKDDLSWFKEAYAEEIKALKKLVNNVQIKWGVVSYST